MNRSNIFFTALFTALTIGLVSCAKKEAPQIPFSRIQGNWKLVQTGTDDNGDGIIESNEIANEPSGNSDVIYFKGDSAGTESTKVDNISSPILNFRWTILQSDSLWVAYSAHDTIVYYIELLNSANLVLATNVPVDSSSILVEKYYNKY